MKLTKLQTRIAGIMLAGTVLFGQGVWAVADPVMAYAAESTVALGTEQTAFEVGTTYIVPLALKNANNLSQDSAAKDCPGKYGKLTVAEDGSAQISVNLRGVTVGTATDYAYDFKIYQGTKASGETVAATVDSTQDVIFKNGEEETPKTVPAQITFKIPEAVKNTDGVYLSMFVDAMGYAPDAYLQIDYTNAKVSGDASINYSTDVATAAVDQFGKYNVNVKVTVTDAQISDVEIEGDDFKGTYADQNEAYLSKAINGTSKLAGMKQKLIGLFCNDSDKLNNLDAVSGATYSSNAIKEAAMTALGVTIEREVIPDAPTEKPGAGLYTIELKDRTDVVDHGLVGAEKKAPAYLRVTESGNMYLTYKMVSGTKQEPLHVLGYNGYYKNNEVSADNLTMDGVTYDTEMMDVPTIGEHSVVTNITIPLDGLRQTYINNVYLYVEAMKNLNGLMSGVDFDNGKFNINSTVTLYWDTLEKVSEDEDKSTVLDDGTYCVTGTMEKPDGTESMSNNAISHNIKLTVKDGVYYATMNFNSLTIGNLSGYLSRLKYYDTGYTTDKQNYPQGTLKDVTVDEWQTYTDGVKVADTLGTDYPNLVTFKLIPEVFTNGGYAPVQVFVPIMEAISAGNGTQNVYLKLDLSSIRKADANDAAFVETEAKKENPSAKPSTDGNQNSNGNNQTTTDTTSGSGNTNTGNTSNTNNIGNDGQKADTATVKAGETFVVSGNTWKVTAAGSKAAVKLVKASAKKKAFTIPATVKSPSGVTCKVTAVAKNAFKNNKKVTTITLGKNVVTIEKNAFKGCKKLKIVKLAKGTSKKLKTRLKKQIKKAGVSKVKVK